MTTKARGGHNNHSQKKRGHTIKIEDQFPQLKRRVCTVAEFAKAVHTGENRVREYIRAGKIRAIRYGRRIVILIEEIDRFLKAESVLAAQFGTTQDSIWSR